ncbi:acyltransferase [Nocardiopsis sp. RSe5-2]|uniref:Acyltransferase n=1 Tax=Nocardiopsis endophytica TaxID=3018445 RepID=A0ABT4TYT7_9ACTN|nr:acyltransferase [Nocardiopsis endophytica]MDA2809860.1 acyltransferase [Nocardiopsis endophytica]
MTTRPAPAPRPVSTAGDGRRLAYIDNLRILLTVLVVLHHCAVTYGNIPAWYHTEPAQDPTGRALDLLVILNQAFFMGMFFLISGLFVPGSADRKGGRRFMRERLVRLGVPLLLFALFLRPLTTVEIYQEYAADAPYWLFYIFSWDPGPLWFVETLLVFCLAYVLIRRLRGRRAPEAAGTDRSGATGARPSGAFPGPAAVAGFTAVLIAATWAWRIIVPVGSFWPVIGLPTPYFLPQYVLMFAVGVLAYRRGWFARIPNAAGWSGLAMAAAGCALLPLSIDAPMQVDPLSLQALVDPVYEGLFAVGIILSLLWLFQRLFNRQGPFARFLSANAYAVYFLHAPVLVGIAVLLSGWQAPALAKFAALGALSLPVCWAAAQALRSLPYAKRVF